MERWDYLASALARKTEETKIGKEKDKEGNKHYRLANPDKFCDFAKLRKTVKNFLKRRTE